MYCGCQCSSARCRRLLPDRSTLLGIFSAEIMEVLEIADCRLKGSFNQQSAISIQQFSRLSKVDLRPRLRAVGRQRAFVADGVRPLEDPVLPGRQAAEDLGLH